MAQDYQLLQSGVTTFGQLYGKINNLAEALRSAFSGNSFPLNPVAGQLCFRTDRTDSRNIPKLYIYTNVVTIGENGWVEIGEATQIGMEVIASRGTKPSLDQRLDVALNEDGTLKSTVQAYQSQWILPSLTFTYVDATTFKVNGNQTDIYTETRRLKINLNASIQYSEVVSSSYNSQQNETTVIIADAVLDNTLVNIEHSIISPISANGAITKQMLNIKVESNVIKIKEGSNWVSRVEDADKVDGYHASQTPTANTIPVANSSGKLDAGWLPEGNLNVNAVEFTSSGTWDVPSGVTKIIVFAIAGGGGGGHRGDFSSDTGGNGGTTSIVGSVSGVLLSLSGGTGGSPDSPGTGGACGTRFYGQIGGCGGNSIFGAGGTAGQNGVGYGSGGGGSGSGCGGGAGHFVNGIVLNVSPNETLTITIGAGGSGADDGGAGKSGFVRIIYFA